VSISPSTTRPFDAPELILTLRYRHPAGGHWFCLGVLHCLNPPFWPISGTLQLPVTVVLHSILACTATISFLSFSMLARTALIVRSLGTSLVMLMFGWLNWSPTDSLDQPRRLRCARASCGTLTSKQRRLHQWVRLYEIKGANATIPNPTYGQKDMRGGTRVGD
jgi:hypothetical protein